MRPVQLQRRQAAARAQVPPGADIVAEQLVDDGQSRGVESEEPTLDEAHKSARRRLPADAVVEEEKVVDSGDRGGSVAAWGINASRTKAKLTTGIPPSAKLAMNGSYRKLLF